MINFTVKIENYPPETERWSFTVPGATEPPEAWWPIAQKSIKLNVLAFEDGDAFSITCGIWGANLLPYPTQIHPFEAFIFNDGATYVWNVLSRTFTKSSAVVSGAPSQNWLWVGVAALVAILLFRRK